MSMTATTPGMTTGAMPDDPLYEVVGGKEVIQAPMGLLEGILTNRLSRRLGNFAEDHDLGQAVSEILFRLKPGQPTMRRPDVAFVSYERWSRELDFSSSNGWEVVPELAVEVVSPTDLAVEAMAKVYEYLEAGVVEVWLVYPELRRVHRFGAAGTMASVGPEGDARRRRVVARLPTALAGSLPQQGVTGQVV